jgi:hypothetical protein
MRDRFFFDLHNGDGNLSDTVGQLMSSDAEVSLQVARILTDIARDEFTINDRRGIISVTVRDDGGRAISIGTLTFSYEILSVP